MCEQTQFSYQSGQVVWVKLSNCWWPGEALSCEELPEDVRTSFKKPPVTVVQFFEEEKYEYVRNYDQVCLYNCKRKHEFIQKGLEMLRKHKNENFMNKFPSDVIRAEELTNGDPDIMKKFESVPDERPDYNIIFGRNDKSPRKGRSPVKLKRNSLPAKQKTNFNMFLPENRVSFGRRSDSALFLSKREHTLHIRVQPGPKKNDDVDNTDNNTSMVSVATSDQMYSCFMCDFKSTRIEGFMAHRKSHLSSTYGSPKPQGTSSKKSRKKTESTGSKRRSSNPPLEGSHLSANRKRVAYSSKAQNGKIEAEKVVSKSVFAKIFGSTGRRGRKEKITAVVPTNSEKKSLQKPLGSKKKTPRKRKNDDVFKTLLADWDDEDPTLLQQEEEKIKKKCKASCFDFDDSADSMLDTELEERANKFARTRNIPIISKPDSSAKKQRLENLPSTSRDVRLLKKRPMEEIVGKSKRVKISVDQDEEEYTKLILADAVPECLPQLSSLPLPCTENNNTVSKESDAIKVPAVTVDKKIMPSTTCVPDVSDSLVDQEVDVPVMEVSGECNSGKHMEHSSGQDELDIVFDDEQELLRSHVNESVLELTKCNTEPSGPMMTDHELLSDLQDDDAMPPSTDIPEQEQIPDSKTATNYISPGVLEEKPPEIETREDKVHERECVVADSRDSAGTVPVDESEGACLSSGKNATGSCLNICSDDVAENIENASVYELRQDEDMPEIICVERSFSQKTTVLHGEHNEENEHISGTAKELVSKVQKTVCDVKTAPISDEVIHFGTTHQVPEELSSHIKEIDGENMSDLMESSIHSRNIDGVCGDLDGASEHHTDNIVTWENKESEGKRLEGDNNEEVTIIGYKCGASTDFRETDEHTKEKRIVAALESSPEISLSCAVRESTEAISVIAHPLPDFNIEESELIKVLDDSADDKKSEHEEICVEDDSSSMKDEEAFTAKVKHTPSSEVSREEIVADWSDDEDNVAPVKEKIIEVIDLDKSENESEDVTDEEITVNKTVANQIASDIVEGVREEEKGGDVMVLKTVHVTDMARDEEMELDINSMPVVVEDAVIKDDGGSNFGSLPPSTSHISVVGTSAPGYPPPKTTAALLLSPSTTSVKTLANNIIVVTSQSRQLPLTARGVFTSPNSKVVIMPRAARGKKFTPILLANSSGITTRVFTESEQESLFREGKKTLLQRVKPKITIQTSKTKPLLPNIQKGGSILDTPSVIMPSKSMVVPGGSLVSVASSSIPTSLKVDPTGVQGTVPKILVRSGTSNIVLQKGVADLSAVSNLTAVSSGTGPEGLKRLTNIFPLVKGSGSGAKQLVISQPSTKPSPSLQGFPKSQIQPLKKTRRMFTCQSPKTSPPLKSVPTTTIEISVSGVHSTQPAVTLAPTLQRGANVSSIPRIPSSAIPSLPRTSVSTTSSIVVGSQDAPSFVFIVDPGNAHHYTTTSNILSYDSSSQSTPPQPVYLEPSSVSTSGNLDSMVITLDGSSSSAATSSVFRLAENSGPSPMFVANGSSGQDILATALANTEVFQPEACLQDTLAVVSNEQSISEAAAMLPGLQGILPVANPSEVLETLTLKEPIMTPHEVPSCMTSIQIQPPAPVSLRASLAASPSMPLLTDDPIDHARSPTLELYENTSSQDTITIQTTLNEEPQMIVDDRR